MVVDDHPSTTRSEEDDRRGRRRMRPLAPLRVLANRRRGVADRWLVREHRRRRLQLAVVAGTVVLAGAGVWLVWFSAWLAVDTVRVSGLSSEAEFAGVDQVEAAAAVTAATPLVRVDTAASAARVAELPWVESVEVFRSWPNAIVIEVVERTPVAVLEQGDVRRGVDASGALFDPPGGLWLTDPVIQGEEGAVAEAVAVVSSLPEELERRVRVVQAVSADDIRLELGNGAIVRWGNAEEGEFKSQVLLALLPRRAQAYDVSAPQLPTTFGEKGPRS